MDNRIIVITGASAGVGRAAARAFAKPGRCIALLARGEAGLEAARREVEASGARAVAIPTDVSDYAQVERAAQRIESECGPIDTWVNDAMLTVFSSVAKLDPAELERVTQTTYLGAAYCTMVALEHMRPRDHGVIVQVGSALAYRAIPLQSAYCAAKFALRGFTDSVRCELMHEGSRVHITSVHLSAFNTPQFEWARNHMNERPQPLPPIFDPALAARAIVWAAGHRRRELFVGFPAVKAILGNKLAPGFLDWLLSRRAWSGQLSGEPRSNDEMDNLVRPSDAGNDLGAEGRFGSRTRQDSWQLRFTMNRNVLAAVLGATVLGGLWAAGRRRVRAGPGYRVSHR